MQRSLSLLLFKFVLVSQAAMGAVIPQSPLSGVDDDTITQLFLEADLVGTRANETTWVNSAVGPADVTLPEPSTLALLGLGLILIYFTKRNRS